MCSARMKMFLDINLIRNKNHTEPLFENIKNYKIKLN